jgi:hypothetical protein
LEPDVDFPLDELPFMGGSKARDEFLEGLSVLGRVLEPRNKVERLSKIPAVIELARNVGEVFQTDRSVLGRLLKNSSSLVLSEVPPDALFLMGIMAAHRAWGRPNGSCLLLKAFTSPRVA